MTLKELSDAVLEHFNYSTDGESEARRRVIKHLNDWQRRILSRPGFERLRQSSTTVASVASTATINLPPSVGRIIRIRDTVNDVTLAERFFDWYRTAEPDPSSNTGIPTVWVPAGEAACAELGATSGTGIWVESTSASDTCRAYIEGVRLGGYVWSDTVVMTGVTRVQVGALADWVEITKFSLSDAAVGTVTLYKVNAAGTALATIPIGKSASKYRRIALWPTPSDAYTYYVDYARALIDMAQDNDEPMLPEDFHWLLETGARLSEYEKTDDTRVRDTRAELERGIGDLRATLHMRDVPVPGRTPVRVISRINGWCPADTVVR